MAPLKPETEPVPVAHVYKAPSALEGTHNSQEQDAKGNRGWSLRIQGTPVRGIDRRDNGAIDTTEPPTSDQYVSGLDHEERKTTKSGGCAKARTTRSRAQHESVTSQGTPALYYNIYFTNSTALIKKMSTLKRILIIIVTLTRCFHSCLRYIIPWPPLRKKISARKGTRDSLATTVARKMEVQFILNITKCWVQKKWLRYKRKIVALGALQWGPWNSSNKAIFLLKRDFE